MGMRHWTPVALAALLAACGGGGGAGGTASGGGTTTPAPVAIQVTAANAAAVGASALDALQNTQATDGPLGLVTAVEVAGPAPLPGPALVLDVLRAVVPWGAAPALASGASVSATQSCPGGGTVRVAGTVALDDGSLRAGDALSLQASGCRVAVNGATTTLDGALAFSVRSGSVPASGSSFSATLQVTATNFSVADATQSARLDGDMALAVSQAGTGTSTVTASGTALTTAVASAGGSRSVTWRNYQRTVSVAAGGVQASLDGTVQTDSTRLGSSGGAIYTVATPAPLRWTTASNVPVAGVLLVTGSGGSSARYSFASGGTVTIAVDGNGDGTAESTSTTSVAALRALL